MKYPEQQGLAMQEPGRMDPLVVPMRKGSLSSVLYTRGLVMAVTAVAKSPAGAPSSG